MVLHACILIFTCRKIRNKEGTTCTLHTDTLAYPPWWHGPTAVQLGMFKRYMKTVQTNLSTDDATTGTLFRTTIPSNGFIILVAISIVIITRFPLIWPAILQLCPMTDARGFRVLHWRNCNYWTDVDFATTGPMLILKGYRTRRQAQLHGSHCTP